MNKFKRNPHEVVAFPQTTQFVKTHLHEAVLALDFGVFSLESLKGFGQKIFILEFGFKT